MINNPIEVVFNKKRIKKGESRIQSLQIGSMPVFQVTLFRKGHSSSPIAYMEAKNLGSAFKQAQKMFKPTKEDRLHVDDFMGMRLIHLVNATVLNDKA